MKINIDTVAINSFSNLKRNRSLFSCNEKVEIFRKKLPRSIVDDLFVCNCMVLQGTSLFEVYRGEYNWEHKVQHLIFQLFLSSFINEGKEFITLFSSDKKFPITSLPMSSDEFIYSLDEDFQGPANMLFGKGDKICLVFFKVNNEKNF